MPDGGFMCLAGVCGRQKFPKAFNFKRHLVRMAERGDQHHRELLQEYLEDQKRRSDAEAARGQHVSPRKRRGAALFQETTVERRLSSSMTLWSVPVLPSSLGRMGNHSIDVLVLPSLYIC